MPRTELAPGVFFTDLPGEKFKRNLLVVHLVVPGQRSLANEHALLPHILERRCASVPDPLALSRQLFDLYGADLAAESYMAGANRIFTVAVSSLKNEFALAGEDLESRCQDLLLDILFAPYLSSGVFDAQDVSIERDKQLDFLRSEKNEKRSYCLRQARRRLFGSSPLGIESAGYLEEMEGVTPSGLYKAYQELLSTASIEVIGCGITAGKTREKLLSRLESIQRAPATPEKRMVISTPPQMIHEQETMDTAQGKLCLMATDETIRDAEGEAVMRVANAVFGGLPTSRLFANVREKQSLCYYCASSYASLRGTLTMDSGVDHKNADRASAAMLAELEQLQKAPARPEELEAAQSAIRNVFRAAKDSPDTMVSWTFNEHLRGSNLSLDQAMENISRVNAAQVQEALSGFQPAIEYRITGKEEL